MYRRSDVLKRHKSVCSPNQIAPVSWKNSLTLSEDMPCAHAYFCAATTQTCHTGEEQTHFLTNYVHHSRFSSGMLEFALHLDDTYVAQLVGESKNFVQGAMFADVSHHSDTAPPQGFVFLERFTRQTSLVYLLVCGTLEQRILSELKRGVSGQGRQREVLSVVSADIVGLIKKSTLSAPDNIFNLPNWSSATEQRCLRFFSADNLRKLLGLYWASWYPNINLLHRANFERNPPNSVLVAVLAVLAVLGLLLLSFHKFSPLLASLADHLAGAYVSSDPADNEDARFWSGPVELIVFPHSSVRYHETTFFRVGHSGSSGRTHGVFLSVLGRHRIYSKTDLSRSIPGPCISKWDQPLSIRILFNQFTNPGCLRGSASWVSTQPSIRRTMSRKETSSTGKNL